jgi:hypothetical protein
MQTGNFSTSFSVDQPAAELFDAVKNIRGWWQGDIAGSSDAEGDEFTYQMKDIHYSKQRVIEFIPGEKLSWLVTESQLNFLQHKDEWTGTKIRFEISEVDGKAKLQFTHEGLAPGIECYGACSNGWTKLIQESLHSLVTTGNGKDVFK